MDGDVVQEQLDMLKPNDMRINNQKERLIRHEEDDSMCAIIDDSDQISVQDIMKGEFIDKLENSQKVEQPENLNAQNPNFSDFLVQGKELQDDHLTQNDFINEQENEPFVVGGEELRETNSGR